MIVGISIIILLLGSGVVSKRRFKKYCYFSIIALNGLYFFFNPILEYRGYDLARYYEQLTYFRQIDFIQIFRISDSTVGDALFHQNIAAYPLYNVYMFIFSRVKFERMLPFFTGIVCRFLELSCTFEIIENRKIKLNKMQQVMLLTVFLLLHNFIEVAGIRNPIAISICIWALTHDLFLNDHKILCLICYIAACLIHSMAFVFVAVRLVMLLINRVTKTSYYLVFFLFFLMMLVISVFPSVLYSVGVSLELPQSIIWTLGKLIDYRKDLTTYPVWQLVMYGFTYISIWFIARKVSKRNQNDKGIKKLFKFLSLYLTILFLNINITSLFSRSRMVIYPLFLVFLCYYLPKNFGKKLGTILVCDDERPFDSICRTAMGICSVVLIFAFDIYATYLPMDLYFNF